MITNFEKIKEEALRLAAHENTPDLAKEYIAKMMESERSLACLINLVAIMIVISPVFAGVLKRSIKENAALGILLGFVEEMEQAIMEDQAAERVEQKEQN